MLDIIHFHPNRRMAEIFVRPLITSEERMGLRSELITSDRSEKFIRFNLSLKNTLALPSSLWKIIITLRREKPSIVISHNTRSSLLPLLAAKICRIKRIIYFNHGVPYLGYPWPINFIFKLIDKLNIYVANETITVSKDMIDALHHISAKKITMINYGSACGIPAPTENLKDKNFKSEIGVKNNEFTIAFIGRPVRRKGYNLTIKMWEKFFANKEGYSLLIYGGSNKKPKNLSWISNLKFMGFTDNVERVISNVDCIILPSYHEGFSYIALEATIYGCTIIASDVPGLRCIVENSKNGYLISVHNMAAYAQAIEYLKVNPINDKVKQKFSKIIYQKYNREKFLTKYCEFLGIENETKVFEQYNKLDEPIKHA